MKNLKRIALVIAAVGCLAGTTVSCADIKTNPNAQDTAAPKPYPLKTCLVCNMMLGEMGKPYVFVYQGQEIKLCDQSEKAEFDNSPDKYMKKLAAAQTKQ